MKNVQLREIDLNLLVLFHAVFTKRSVSGAAEQLRMSQSAVSHGLGRLRDLFHDELFVRSGLSMTPTLLAGELSHPVEDIMHTLHSRVLTSVRFDPTTSGREFRIGASDAGEIVILPSLLRHISQRFKGCSIRTVRLNNDEIPVALESNEIELAISSLPDRPQHFYEQVLYHHGYSVIAWSQHPRLQETLSLQDFLTETHVLVASGSDQHLISSALAPNGWTRKVIATVGGFLGLPWLLERNEWVATVPTHIAEVFKQSFSIRSFSLPFSIPSFPIASHWHARLHDDPGHRWLRQLVFDLLHRYPDLP